MKGWEKHVAGTARGTRRPMNKPFSEWTVADVEAHNAKVRRPMWEADGTLNVDLPTRFQEQAPKKSKYRNEKTLADGFVFDSRKEAECWLVCRVREKAGEITELARQVDFPLYAPILERSADGTGRATVGMSAEIATYRADIVYRDVSDGKKHIIDAKGFRTRMFLLKRKWLSLQENIQIEEI